MRSVNQTGGGGNASAAETEPAPLLRAAARRYVASGLSVIPIRADGSKAPKVRSWKQYQKRLPTDAEVDQWFAGDQVGIAIVTGCASGNLEVIDFDDAAAYEEWTGLIDEMAPGLRERLPIVRTPRPGIHVYYRAASITASQKLAFAPWTDPATGRVSEQTLIETKGEGGYVLAPGCPARCHPTGRTYMQTAGPALPDTPLIAAEEQEALLSCARALDRTPKKIVDERRDAPKDGSWVIRPGDDYRERTDWRDVIGPAGWQAVYQKGDVTYWRRPSKEAGISASTGHCGDKLYVFSTNAPPFEARNAYSQFAAYTLLNHAGDFRAAARELARLGYGRPDRRNGSGPDLGPPRAPRQPAEPDVSDRNGMLASLAGTMRRCGMGEPAILSALLVENAGRCVPPLAKAEVLRIVASIARYAPDAVTAEVIARAGGPPDDGTNGTNGKRPNGVNFDVQRVRVYTGEPAVYEFTIDGRVVTLTGSDLLKPKQFQQKVLDAIGRVPRLPKKLQQYLDLVDQWLSQKEVVQPPEASPAVFLRERIERAVNNLALCDDAEASDLDRGTAMLHKGLKIFKSTALVVSLHSPDATSTAVCRHLRDLGFFPKTIWLDGKAVCVWCGAAPEVRRPAAPVEEEPL